MYFTRGYTFQTYQHGSRRKSANYGIYVRGDSDFYGVINQIVQVRYPGTVNLRCVLLRCDWYDPNPGRGVRVDNLGVKDILSNRRYTKFEPFVLASQAEQVSFIPYPRIRERREQWFSVVHINPRGRIIGAEDDIVLQEDRGTGNISNCLIESTDDITLVDPNEDPEDLQSTEDEGEAVGMSTDEEEEEDDYDDQSDEEEDENNSAYADDGSDDE